jgi:4-cresol dehydrogenase (hydroxylating)
MATLPPGINARTFARVLVEFEAAVGREWVFSSDEDVDLYRDAYSVFWGEAAELRASAAVAPASTEQVQAVVRIANRYKIPLYPISTGKNLTYGGSAPNMTGSVVVDLKRMNRILEVDDTRNFALVEPGVSYFDLYRHIQDRGLKLWIDCPDPGWGSPIGNALDHGVGYTWGNFRDHFGSRCGMEVVLPDGEVIRTGMGSLPGAETWQEFRYNMGPQVDGLFGQANFGIVTKMGFWLLPEPECFMTGTVMVPRYMDLIPLVKLTNYFDDTGLSGMPIYGSPVSQMGPPGTPPPPPDPDLDALVANGWPGVADIEAYVAKKGRPAFSVELHFFGPEETCLANWNAAKRKYGAAIPGATFRDGVLLRTPLTDADKDRVGKRNIGVPGLSVFAMVSRNAGSPPNPPDGHADLLPVVPRTGEALMKVARVMFEFGREQKMPGRPNIFITPQAWHPRTFLAGGGVFPTYRDDPEGNKRTREQFVRMIEVLAQNGWGDYRTAPAFQDALVGQYSYNSGALLKYQQKLKDATDPNGIIAPGRYGLWPKGKRPPQA